MTNFIQKYKKTKLIKSKKDKILKYTKGFRGSKNKKFKTAHQGYIKSLQNKYKDKRLKKRNYKKLWISRINSKLHNFINWSNLQNKLKNYNIKLNRKMCCFLLVQDENTFLKILINFL